MKVQTGATVRQSLSGSAAVSAGGTPNAVFTATGTISVGQIKFTLEGGNGQNADTFAATIASGLGAAWNGTLCSYNMNGVNTYIFTLPDGYTMFAGDALNFSFPNSGNLTWGIEVIYAGIF